MHVWMFLENGFCARFRGPEVRNETQKKIRCYVYRRTHHKNEHLATVGRVPSQARLGSGRSHEWFNMPHAKIKTLALLFLVSARPNEAPYRAAYRKQGFLEKI